MAIKFVSYLRKSSDMLYIKELTGAFVDSVKTVVNYRFVKVGQTKSYLGNQRHLHLNATNKCNLEDLTEMLSLAHPFDIRYKLTDHIVRKQVVEDNKNVKAIDKLFAKNAFGMSDGFSEILMFPSDWTTEKICKTITSSYNKLMNSDVSKFTKNTEREDEYNKNKNEYIVPTSIAELMITKFDAKDKRILLIRQFPDWFVDRICCLAKEVVYVIDNPNVKMDLPKHSNLSVVLADDCNEAEDDDLIEVIKTMPEKFDLLIANPPYKIGGKVISEAMKHCDEAVVLMPISKYKMNKLFKHVKDCSVVPSSAFKDAAIARDELCICTLCNSYDNNMFTSEEFRAFYKTPIELREFFILNQRLPRIADNRLSTKFPVDVTTTFMISCQVGNNGVHKTEDCMDYRWNVLNDTTFHLPTENQGSSYKFTPYRFANAESKNNLTRFWYNNPLMNKLIKGGTSHIIFIPRIDWSVDRDYEHMTYEELLEIVKHDLRAQGLSDEVN